MTSQFDFDDSRAFEMKPEQEAELLDTLQNRFEKNPKRHPKLAWADVQARLEANREKLRALAEMERTGGEPDVIGQDAATGAFIFNIEQ